MQRRKKLEEEKETDIIVIAVWVEHRSAVYSAEEGAARLVYSDTGLDPQRELRYHRDEDLAEGDIVPSLIG
ncbi:hypothetical protein N7450_011457 [Penicillium hetheringtonii]|uniref:Uncharacterized protein n=1 Tax=Penicillium hetheringtonii TaxID=911720 RepID=A0AAD6GL03_9EURO|nr:hypothetical protein N7450_011457 [Penicillium hetheringtonii]